MALIDSGVGEQLDDAKLLFADLNYEEVRWVEKRRRIEQTGRVLVSPLGRRGGPAGLDAQDENPSLGRVTAAQNLYGTSRASSTAGPKTCPPRRHSETVFDINASLPKAIAIVDGIECMEGDGPIMGRPNTWVLVVVGETPRPSMPRSPGSWASNPRPSGTSNLAGGHLGPLEEAANQAVGERRQDVASPFQIMPHLQDLRPRKGRSSPLPRRHAAAGGWQRRIAPTQVTARRRVAGRKSSTRSLCLRPCPPPRIPRPLPIAIWLRGRCWPRCCCGG